MSVMLSGMDVLERKFLAKYGGMTEDEYWWYVEQHLTEKFEKEKR